MSIDRWTSIALIGAGLTAMTARNTVTVITAGIIMMAAVAVLAYRSRS